MLMLSRITIADTVKFDKSGLAVLRHGDSEVRLTQDPFPLYPGEKLAQGVKELPLIQPNTAFRLLAVRDVYNEKGEVTRKAGEEWLEYGPACVPFFFAR
jgi:major vault protein